MTKQNIDIKVVIDPSLLRQDYSNPSQDPDHPTSISQDDAFMVAIPNHVVSCGNATAMLELKACHGDVIRWHMKPAAINRYYVIVYRIGLLDYNEMGGAAIDEVEADGEYQQQVTTLPMLLEMYRFFPIPDSVEPTRYTESGQYKELYWACDIKRHGQQRYQLFFSIVAQDDLAGTVDTIGYYSWEPVLVISELK